MQLIVENYCSVVKSSELGDRKSRGIRQKPFRDQTLSPAWKWEWLRRSQRWARSGNAPFAFTLTLGAANPVSSAQLNTKERRKRQQSRLRFED